MISLIPDPESGWNYPEESFQSAIYESHKGSVTCGYGYLRFKAAKMIKEHYKPVEEHGYYLGLWEGHEDRILGAYAKCKEDYSERPLEADATA